MILQNILFSDDICKDNELFFRVRGDIDPADMPGDKGLHIPAGVHVSFDTYMNIFDLKKWRELTCVEDVYLEAECTGEGTVRVFFMDTGKKKEVALRHFDASSDGKAELHFDIKDGAGYLQVEAEAEGEFLIKSLCFSVSDTHAHPVKLAAVICTYGRTGEVLATIDRLSGLKDLSLYVVDNKKEITEKKEENLTIVQNENTGGAGGFTRGLELIRKDNDEKNFSNVIFLDDDACVNAETVKRTHALLSFLKPEYRDRNIAGRMFLLEEPWVQHTAAEVWNGGDIRHVGGSMDMRRRENLPEINDAQGGEYGGFWFSCVPYAFAKVNDPLPLFLHCDDVEYGLRQGKEPVILNGIQVWHESPLRRGTSTAAYYDIRNSMIVNSLGYDGEKTVRAASDILKKWRKKLDLYRDNHDIDSENMALLAMEHFLKGPGWVYNADGGRLHRELLDKRSVEAINKRVLRLAVKLPYGKINEFKRARTESTAIKELKKAVKEYRLWSKEKRVADYADENI